VLPARLIWVLGHIAEFIANHVTHKTPIVDVESALHAMANRASDSGKAEKELGYRRRARASRSRRRRSGSSRTATARSATGAASSPTAVCDGPSRDADPRPGPAKVVAASATGRTHPTEHLRWLPGTRRMRGGATAAKR
jgi:hypothetical protein